MRAVRRRGQGDGAFKGRDAVDALPLGLKEREPAERPGGVGVLPFKDGDGVFGGTGRVDRQPVRGDDDIADTGQTIDDASEVSRVLDAVNLGLLEGEGAGRRIDPEDGEGVVEESGDVQAVAVRTDGERRRSGQAVDFAAVVIGVVEPVQFDLDQGQETEVGIAGVVVSRKHRHGAGVGGGDPQRRPVRRDQEILRSFEPDEGLVTVEVRRGVDLSQGQHAVPRSAVEDQQRVAAAAHGVDVRTVGTDGDREGAVEISGAVPNRLGPAKDLARPDDDRLALIVRDGALVGIEDVEIEVLFSGKRRVGEHLDDDRRLEISRGNDGGTGRREVIRSRRRRSVGRPVVDGDRKVPRMVECDREDDRRRSRLRLDDAGIVDGHRRRRIVVEDRRPALRVEQDGLDRGTQLDEEDLVAFRLVVGADRDVDRGLDIAGVDRREAGSPEVINPRTAARGPDGAAVGRHPVDGDLGRRRLGEADREVRRQDPGVGLADDRVVDRHRRHGPGRLEVGVMPLHRADPADDDLACRLSVEQQLGDITLLGTARHPRPRVIHRHPQQELRPQRRVGTQTIGGDRIGLTVEDQRHGPRRHRRLAVEGQTVDQMIGTGQTGRGDDGRHPQGRDDTRTEKLSGVHHFNPS